MSKALSKAYDHRQVEERWYARWLEGGYFTPDAESDKPPFPIMMPPPSVTGSLHIGHALTATIQDTLIRWKRMSGFKTLWLPGTDHAGIATQMVVERHLKEEGLTRFDLGREEFLAKVWAWKEIYHARITKQHRALGTSCDWTRERFTMDEGLSRAVREVFVRLYEEGLIYQAHRMVNWSPGCQTVLSDLEVEHEDRQGSLWHFAYPVADSDEQLIVATTRPETMLGDTAVAVHPDDPRYQHLIGKEIALPLTDRRIPIIADPILVDMEFGTGAVKVTPAHDVNDFETGKRHNLPMITVLDKFAKMIDPAPEKYQGMDRNAARKAIVADMDALGLLVKIDDHPHSVGICQRSQVVVEPMLSLQWYVRTETLAKPAADAVREGRTKIVPATWEKTYFHWMDNIRDWCISRQLWWGHQIPAWHCADCDHVTVSRDDPTECGGCSSTAITQDEDVLDTWFSSGLWPFSTLGWPEQTPDLKAFYPNAILETGFDILFFWVARMMMMGIHFMGEVPFHTIMLHAMVRDEHGHKMSKTRGNVIDPLEVSETYGADALRMTVARLAGHGRDIKLSMHQVEGSRNFINKVYQATRFGLLNLEDFDPNAPAPTTLNRIDHWILRRLDAAITQVDETLERLAINEAATTIYQFFWGELCDWYIELSKPVLYAEDAPEKRRATQHTLVTVLDAALRLMHPFVPFASEEIWSALPLSDDRPEALIIADFPQPGQFTGDQTAEAEVEAMIAVVGAVRNVRGELQIGEGKKPHAILRAPDEQTAAFLGAESETLIRLCRLSGLSVQVLGDRPEGAAMQLAGDIEVYLPLAGLIDFVEELARLDKAIGKVRKQLEQVEKKLANPRFVDNAPDAVVQLQRDRLADGQAQIDKLEASRARIVALSEHA